jgi:hypothetical protein
MRMPRSKFWNNGRPGRRLTGTLVTLLACSLFAYSTIGAAPAAASSPFSPSAPDGYQPPPIKHVWLIIFENKSFEATFTGLNQDSYMWKTLPSYGVLLRQYYGTGHYSEDNYLSLASGQAPAPDTQIDCPVYQDVVPGTSAPDGQVYAKSGCVYPATVPTLFNQLDSAGVTWKAYMEDMGNTPTREPAPCGGAGNPSGKGVANPQKATADDQYLAKHNPTTWFHAIIDSGDCARSVVPLAGAPATAGHPAVSGLVQDLKSEATTPEFNWITPNMCNDAHDATCVGTNVLGTHQGGLFAANAWLAKYIPIIMSSPAFQDNGMIDITFDEATPPYKVYTDSNADLAPIKGVTYDTQTPSGNTAQSVVACCNELPGPNVAEPGRQAAGQDTTPGGGITGSIVISRYVTPGTQSDQPYNHYSWLRSMEDLFGVTSGGVDQLGHIGYAGTAGLRPFGPDVYSNPSGKAGTPAASGSNGIFAGRSGTIDLDHPALGANGSSIPDSTIRPAGDAYPEPMFATLPGANPGP